MTWTSGVDGQDPLATIMGLPCTGNGLITDDPTMDPADCIDSGANVNLLGNVHDDAHPLSVGTNNALSGFTCFDAVDGNEWTFLGGTPFGWFPSWGIIASGVEPPGDSD
jgi:hypothetical protein